MSSVQPDLDHFSVSSAFDLLVNTLDHELKRAHRDGGRSITLRDYEALRAAITQAEAIAAFRVRVAALHEEWQSLTPAPPAPAAQPAPPPLPQPTPQPTPPPAPDHTARRTYLAPGLRTPKCDFYLPILRTLVRFGGSGLKHEVLDEVGCIMQPIFRDVDLVPIHEDGEGPRWRTTASWARYEMVRQGLLRSDSPPGTWEISPEGEAYLDEHPEQEGD